MSNRSGHLTVWVADRSGANARELAPTVAPNAPAWSPTADAIAYTCRFGNGPEDICTIGVSGGQARRFTAGGARHLFPSWSRDGRSLYFASDRSNGFQIWKAPIDNPANATRLTRGGGYWGTESPDGQSVFYAKTAPSGPIWRVDAGGGDEREVAEEVRSLRLPQNFAVGQEGLYYADSDQPAQGFEIRFWSFAKRKAESIWQIKRGLGNGMALAPDGRTLFFTTMELNSGDLFLISNFR